MTNESLARSYLGKAGLRLEALALLKARGGYSDVVREAQELVELCLKGMLRAVGVEPPKFHDVGDLLLQHGERFPAEIRGTLGRVAEISKRLRKDRELAFYGDIDFIPTEEYSGDEAELAYADAEWIVTLARRLIGGPSA